MIIVKIKRLPNNPDLPLPRKMSQHSAGFDLTAAVESPVTIEPAKTALVPIGVALSIPQGYEGQVRPRSGLAVNYGLTILNAPGTIDSDYRGELKVALINLGSGPFTIRRGDRVAQLVIAPVAPVALEETVDLDPTSRGEGGFGHTGV